MSYKYSKPVRITTESVERNIKLQREQDVRQRELAAFGKESANLISAANAQTKIDMQRRLIQQQVCKTEQIQEEKLKKDLYEKQFHELTISQNQALSSELDKDAADRERRLREIQQICEESPELRELQAVLKIAYLNKERAAQYEEKILLATKEQERIQAIEDQMEYERLRAIRTESEKDKEKKKLYENQREVLQRQINEKHQQLLEARHQIDVERQMVDEIIQRINNEDEADYRKRKEKQAATALMVKNFEEQRRRELDMARAAERAEEERIASYNRAMEARNEGVAAKKQAKKDEEDRILQQIVEETERKKREQEEFDNLRDMLWEEELEAKRTREAEGRRQKQHQMKTEMMEANSQIKKSKELQRQQEAETEAKLVSLMRQKFSADERKEQQEEENRRRTKLHHMSLVEQQRQDRKQMYEQEKQGELLQIEESRRREEYRLKVIQEARKRLLQEHGQRLEEFMPSKVFENKQEWEEFKGKKK